MLVVVFHHYGFPGFPGGYVGVDIFFVISGFLITSIIHREIAAGRFSFRQFYLRRARRLLPAFFLVAATTLAIGHFVLFPDDYVALAWQAIYSSAGIANFYFYDTIDYFSRPAELQPMLHMWSLGVEEQFYLVWPPVLFVLVAWWKGDRGPVALALALIIVLSFAGSAYTIATDQPAAFYLPHLRAWELAVGALLAFAPVLVNAYAAQAARAIGLALIIASVALLQSTSEFPGINALWPCVGAALLIWPSSQRAWPSRLLSLRPIVFVGLVSYPLYLWHWPLAALARHWSLDETMSVQIALALAVASFGLACGTYLLLERPIRSQRLPAMWRAPLAMASIAVIMVAATAIIAASGIPSRLHPYAYSLASGATDSSPFRRKCHRNDRTKLPISESCVFGNVTSKPRFAIWADSHGVELSPAIGEALGANGASLTSITYSSCPPAINFDARKRKHCRAHNDRVLAYLVGAADIEHVVLISIYRGYFLDQPERFESGMDEAVRALTAAGKKVTIFEPVPRAPFSVPQWAAKMQLRAPGTDLFVDLDEYRELHREVIAMIDRVAKRSDAQVVRTSDILCDKTSCRLTKEGKSLYFDRHHLSNFGAAYLVSALMKMRSEPFPPASQSAKRTTRSIIPGTGRQGRLPRKSTH